MLQLHVPHVSGERDSHNRYSFRLHVARVTAISSKMTALGGYHHLLLHPGILAPPLRGERAQWALCVWTHTQCSDYSNRFTEFKTRQLNSACLFQKQIVKKKKTFMDSSNCILGFVFFLHKQLLLIRRAEEDKWVFTLGAGLILGFGHGIFSFIFLLVGS